MRIEHFKRYFGYTFWVALEAVISLGLPRLVIFPVAAYLLGKEEFGLFIFLLGIVMMIGEAPAGGLATGVIRHLANFEGQTKELLVSSSLRLCKIAMIVIVAMGIVVLAIVRYFWQVDPKIIWCLVPLLILLGPSNLFELQMVRYRVERRFALRTAWYSFLSILLFIAIPAVIFYGVVGMAWGYMFGYLTAYVVLSWRQGVLFKKPAYKAELGSLLKQIWFHVTVASILGLSARYIYRVVLRVFYSYSDVSVFFGATNVVDICMSPTSILSLLLLSMLGGFAHLEDVGKRQRYIVVALVVSLAVGAPLLVLFAGPFILSVMFPGFAGESAPILKLIAIAIPCWVVIEFSRPFIVKFGPIKFIPVLNFITFVSHLLPGVILIPRFGIKGAAISYSIGYGLSSISYLGVLAWTFKFGRGYKPDVKFSLADG